MEDYRQLIPIEHCARCGYDEELCSLHVHHIDNNHENNDPNNLIVLCGNCHVALHNKKWKLSDIGIFGCDHPISKVNYKHMEYLLKKNKSLQTNLANANAEIERLKHELNRDPTLDHNRRLALYAYLIIFGYSIRDRIAFFNSIPDSYFTNIDGENGIYTRDLVHSIHDVYNEIDKDTDMITIIKILDNRLNYGKTKREKIKNNDICELTLTELALRSPIV